MINPLQYNAFICYLCVEYLTPSEVIRKYNKFYNFCAENNDKVLLTRSFIKSNLNIFWFRGAKFIINKQNKSSVNFEADDFAIIQTFNVEDICTDQNRLLWLNEDSVENLRLYKNEWTR